MLDRDAVGGAHAHTLHDAVGQDCQRLTVLHREQQHQSDVAIVGRGSDLFPAHGIAPLGPGNDIGVDAHGADAEAGSHTIHRLEAVERIPSCGRRKAVGAGTRYAAPFGQFGVGLFHDSDAFAHRQERFDIVIGEDQRHSYVPAVHSNLARCCGRLSSLIVGLAGGGQAHQRNRPQLRPARRYLPRATDRGRELSHGPRDARGARQLPR